MPLYEYQCEACGHRFETIQKFSDPPLTACPKCGGAVNKLQSAPAFQFKGSGWYITDYARKDSGSSSPEATSKGDSKADAKSETKTESKTETGVEAKKGESTPAKSDAGANKTES